MATKEKMETSRNSDEDNERESFVESRSTEESQDENDVEEQLTLLDSNPSIQERPNNNFDEDLVAEVQNEIEDDKNASVFHPSRLPYKLVVLVFICFLVFGSYYIYDNPAALQKQILSEMDVTLSDYTLLYSIYSWPSVVMSLVGGFLVDAIFGIPLGTVIFSVVIAFGQFIVAFGAFINQYWIMIIGRFIYALGGGTLGICQNLYSAVWFKGSVLNMVFGIGISVARLGSSVNLWSMQPIYNAVQPQGSKQPGNVGLGITLFIGGIVCIFSLTCAIILFFLDRHAKKVLKWKERKSKATCADLKAIAMVRYFPLQMWLIAAICMSYYVALFPFVGMAQTFYIQKYSLHVSEANTVNSLIYTISLFAAPALGFLVDRTGRNVFWVMLGCFLTIIAHGLLAFSFINPYIGAGLFGISYSLLASSLWPLVAYVMPVEKLGTAYGVMQAFQDIGLAIMAQISGIVVDTKGYFMLEIVFLLCLFIAISCTLVLWIVDGTQTSELNMPASERRRLATSKP